MTTDADRARVIEAVAQPSYTPGRRDLRHDGNRHQSQYHSGDGGNQSEEHGYSRANGNRRAARDRRRYLNRR